VGTHPKQIDPHPRQPRNTASSFTSFSSSTPVASLPAIAAEKLAQSQQEDMNLDYSDWPGPPDENGLQGPAVHRREVEYHLNQLRSLNALEALQKNNVPAGQTPGQNDHAGSSLSGRPSGPVRP
jgi:hypothetical protein